MSHTREEVINRAIQEYELMERLIAGLSDEDWQLPLGRPEGKDPWTVKDAVVHIIYWKAGVARSARRQPQPPEIKGLNYTRQNHIVYQRYHDSSSQEILAWHRQVHEDVLAALREAPEKWFTRRDRGEDWPGDLDGHSAYHRVKDIERVLAHRKGK